MNFRPRNDFVLIKIVDVGESPGGVAIPQISVQGKEFHVVATGPKVFDLHVGDQVLMVGKQGIDYYPLPNSIDLLVIKQEHVVLITRETPDFYGSSDEAKEAPMRG